jgi:hypothetical protein
MKHVKLFEAFVNEGKSVLDLTKVQKEITKKCKDVDGVEITKGNKLTGIKELEIKSDWITSLKVKSDGNIYTDDSLSAVGGFVKSESELYKFVNSIIQQEIDYHKQTTEAFVNEASISKEGYALNRLADDQVGGVPATEFQEEHNLDLDAIKRAITHTEELTRYELRDIIKGTAPKSKIKRFLKEYSK